MTLEFILLYTAALIFHGIFVYLVHLMFNFIEKKRYTHNHFKKTERYRSELQ